MSPITLAMDDQAWYQLWSSAPTLVGAAFVFAFGACVGSFLNVLCFRLPAGMSIASPPSRCGTCGRRLRWFENLPILGWILAGGRCRTCGDRVSAQYPLVEAATALLFAALFLLLFAVRPGPGLGGVTNGFFHGQGFGGAWPAFAAWLTLVAGTLAAAIIDARTFLIPIQITGFITASALALWVVQLFLPISHRTPPGEWAIPVAGWTGTACGLAGCLGLGVSVLLLWARVIRPSFHDYDDFVAPGETLAAYPHARREMVRELLFLMPCIVGVTTALLLSPRLPADLPPLWLQALAAPCLGILVGGGLIWAIRILGSLAFGKEAMGMGDVHLMAAAGAVLGWAAPIGAFLVAIFVALGWTLAASGWAALWKRRRRELPLGPHLAVGILMVMFARPVLVEIARLLWPLFVPESAPGLFTNPS